MTNYKSFWMLFVVALFLRLYLATLPGFKIDVESFFAWAIRLTDLGTTGFYSPDVFTDYTPGYLYILNILGYLGKNLTPSQFYFTLKLPAILAEVGLGFLIFKIALDNKFTTKTSLFFSSLVLFNPGLIFNSSVWGQVDSVLTLVMVLAIYFLNQKRYFIASIFSGLSFLIKPQTISIFPVFLLYLVSYKQKKTFINLVLPAVVIILSLSLPFFITTDPFLGLVKKVLATSKEYPYTSLFAFNFWGIVKMWQNDLDIWYYSLSYQTWGYLLFAFFWLVTSWIYFKKHLTLYALSSLATLIFYFLPTRVHDRYLYPALVFLVLAAIELRTKWLTVTQILLSLTYTLNLYYVYIYYNYYYSHTNVAFFDQNLYNLIDQHLKLFSILSTLIFVLIILIIFNTDVRKNLAKS